MAPTFGIGVGEAVRARPTRSMRLDAVFVPFHWGGVGFVDLASKISEPKLGALHVARAEAVVEAKADAGTAGAIPA